MQQRAPLIGYLKCINAEPILCPNCTIFFCRHCLSVGLQHKATPANCEVDRMDGIQVYGSPGRDSLLYGHSITLTFLHFTSASCLSLFYYLSQMRQKMNSQKMKLDFFFFSQFNLLVLCFEKKITNRSDFFFFLFLFRFWFKIGNNNNM